MQFCNNKMNPRYFIIEPLILEFSIWYIVCLKSFRCQMLTNLNQSCVWL
jgi:hypothetical protein